MRRFLRLDEFNEHLVLQYYTTLLKESGPILLTSAMDRAQTSDPNVVKCTPGASFLLRHPSTTNVFKNLSKIPSLLLFIFGAHKFPKSVEIEVLRWYQGQERCTPNLEMDAASVKPEERRYVLPPFLCPKSGVKIWPHNIPRQHFPGLYLCLNSPKSSAIKSPQDASTARTGA